MIGTEQERAALMAAVEAFGNARADAAVALSRSKNPDDADDRYDEANARFDAIRAMLAPDDAVVRTEVAAVIATRIIHPNAVYMNGPFRSRSEQDRCEWAADEIIAVLRGEATR